MEKFHDKFPNATTQDTIDFQGDVLVKGSKAYPCGKCADPTHFISASFHTYPGRHIAHRV